VFEVVAAHPGPFLSQIAGGRRAKLIGRCDHLNVVVD
jgi:hypothetical protein